MIQINVPQNKALSTREQLQLNIHLQQLHDSFAVFFNKER